MIMKLFVTVIIFAIQILAAAERPAPIYAIIDTSAHEIKLMDKTTEIDTISCDALRDLPICKAKLRIDPDIIMIYQPIEGEDGNIMLLMQNENSSFCVDNIPAWIVEEF